MKQIKMRYNPRTSHPWSGLDVEALSITAFTNDLLNKCIENLPDWEVWIKGEIQGQPGAYLIRQIKET